MSAAKRPVKPLANVLDPPAAPGANVDPPPILAVKDLEVAYGPTQVIFGVSLEVPDGGLCCLMGRNGVGKSTLLQTIVGLQPARAGHDHARATRTITEGRRRTTARRRASRTCRRAARRSRT